MLLAEMGKMSEAEQAFRTAYKADPKSAQAAYNLGILLSKGQPQEALTWSRRATELRPENPQYGYTYAFFLASAGKYRRCAQSSARGASTVPLTRREPVTRTAIAKGPASQAQRRHGAMMGGRASSRAQTSFSQGSRGRSPSHGTLPRSSNARHAPLRLESRCPARCGRRSR